MLSLNDAVNASSESVDISLTQYRQGATDYNRVFNLQTALVADQDTLAATQGALANSLIAAYKAVGGGWEIRYGIRRGATNTMIEAVPVPDVQGAIADQTAPLDDTVPRNVDAQADRVPALPEDMLPPVPKD